MNDFKIEKVNGYQLFNANTLEPIGELGYVMAEPYVEPSSLSKETLCFNQKATFECELPVDASPLVDYMAEEYEHNGEFEMEYQIPIRIQARWHKKHRINKKWLKRYGMKEDVLSINMKINEIALDTECKDAFEMELAIKEFRCKFRPDQLRKNLKIELVV